VEWICGRGDEWALGEVCFVCVLFSAFFYLVQFGVGDDIHYLVALRVVLVALPKTHSRRSSSSAPTRLFAFPLDCDERNDKR